MRKRITIVLLTVALIIGTVIPCLFPSDAVTVEYSGVVSLTCPA